jgi:hypothetical protein
MRNNFKNETTQILLLFRTNTVSIPKVHYLKKWRNRHFFYSRTETNIFHGRVRKRESENS